MARVCESCFVGVLLETATEAVPGGAPFLVVDSSLKISAVSDSAERLLELYEQDANGHHVFEFLVSADAEDAESVDNFAVAISAAADTVAPIRHAGITLRRRRSVSCRLRIATCGPPRAALVVFSACSDGGRPLQVAAG